MIASLLLAAQIGVPQCIMYENHHIAIRQETTDIVLTIATFPRHNQAIVWSPDGDQWSAISDTIHQIRSDPYEYRIPRSELAESVSGFFSYIAWPTNAGSVPPCVFKPWGSGGGGGNNGMPQFPDHLWAEPPIYYGVEPRLPWKEIQITGSLESILRQTDSERSARNSTEPPLYSSSSIETNEFEGVLTCPDGVTVKLYGRSDDGTDVYVNGNLWFRGLGSPQNWKKPESFWELSCFKGTNHFRVVYSNIIRGKTGDNDDGIRMWYVLGGDPPALVGPDRLPTFSTEEEDALGEFHITGNVLKPIWSLSGNLRMVENHTNYIFVRGIAGSSATNSDSVSVSFSQCSAEYVELTRPVTILTPKHARLLGTLPTTVTRSQLASYAGYVVYDQFGEPWDFSGYVSEFTWHSPLGASDPYIPWPDEIDVRVNDYNGFFFDYIRGPVPKKNKPVIRNQGWTIRAVPGGKQQGKLIRGGWIEYSIPVVLGVPKNSL